MLCRRPGTAVNTAKGARVHKTETVGAFSISLWCVGTEIRRHTVSLAREILTLPILKTGFRRKKARLEPVFLGQELAKTGEGGSGGGACFPVHRLVKIFFDKLGKTRVLRVGGANGETLTILNN